MPRKHGASWKNLLAKSKSTKPSLPFQTVIDKTEIINETNIASEFNNFFTDRDLKLVKKIPESSQVFPSYMKNVSSELENKFFPINELKDIFFSFFFKN